MNPTGFHFSGHGERDSLWLENDECRLDTYSQDTLVDGIKNNVDLQFIFLAACYSKDQLKIF